MKNKATKKQAVTSRAVENIDVTNREYRAALETIFGKEYLRQLEGDDNVVKVEITSTPQSDMPDQSLPFRTKEDLKKLLNLRPFREAVAATTDIDLLRLADDFVEEQVRGIVQEKIKKELWGKKGKDIPAGAISFHTVKEVKESGDYYYLRAQTTGTSTNARASTPAEIQAYESEPHTSRARKNQTEKMKARG